MHGGTIRADSDGPGCGSTFTIELPRIADGVLDGDAALAGVAGQNR